MVGGGYQIKASGLTELISALEKTATGVQDLHAVSDKVARQAWVNVHQRAPQGHASAKDSHSHKPSGNLRRHITKGVAGNTAFVELNDVDYGILQEFGGHSYWHHAGKGALRSRKHARVEKMSGGRIRVGNRATKGHIIYEKPRQALGYFIWNVAFRIRDRLISTYTEGVADICRKNGLNCESRGL